MKTPITLLALTLTSTLALANTSPVGLWKTTQDDAKTEKSLVRITDQGGSLNGRVEKLFEPSRADSRCDKCIDDRKDQPLLGMAILRNARRDLGNPLAWSGGEILDPSSGKTYRTRLTVVDGGRTLEMRVFLGPISRLQLWTRVD
jgi:uncharacterized protein (DUF2147 family)